MKRKLLLPVIAVCCSLIATAQTAKFSFQSSVATGLIAGAVGPALQLQTVNGVKYKTWSAGIGAGLDYYRSRTIPLFIDVRKTLTDKSKTPFIYLDGGYNFRWLTAPEKEASIIETKGGLYYDAGIGYQLPVFKKHNLFFSLGYSGKHISNTEQGWIYIDMIWPGRSTSSDYVYHYQYKLQRLCLKAGLSL